MTFRETIFYFNRERISTGTKNGAKKIVEVKARVKESVRGRKFVCVCFCVCVCVRVCVSVCVCVCV